MMVLENRIGSHRRAKPIFHMEVTFNLGGGSLSGSEITAGNNNLIPPKIGQFGAHLLNAGMASGFSFN
jgi:hypothetical protein